MGGMICGLRRASSCDGNFELNRYVPVNDSNDMVKLPWDIVKRGNSMQEKNTSFFFSPRGKSRSTVCIHLMADLIIVQTAYMHDLLFTV